MQHVILTQLQAAQASLHFLKPLLEDLAAGKTPEPSLAALAPHAAAQAIAATAAAEALVEAWENGPAASLEPEPDDGACKHPPDRRKPIMGAGPSDWRCFACGHEERRTHDA